MFITFKLTLYSQYQRHCVLLPPPAGGFYSQLVKPGLRLVSLNTILYYGPNKVTENMTDPAGQFLWLEKTLLKASQNQEKVSNAFLDCDLYPRSVFLFKECVCPSRCTSSLTYQWGTCPFLGIPLL